MKKMIINLWNKFNKTIKKYPLTCISILICIICLEICVNDSIEIVKDILLSFSLLFCSSLLFESLDYDKKENILIYIIFFIILYGLATLRHYTGEIVTSWIERIMLCYGISFIVMAIYTLFKKSKLKFDEYVLRVMSNLLKVSIINIILNIGFVLLVLLFTFLLFGNDYILVERVLIILNGVYFVPGVISSINETDETPEKFFKIIFKYVFGILLLIAFAVIYLYIIKIIFTFDIPSNEIFRILCILFFLGLPVWSVVNAYKEDDFLSKISNKLPIIFIPFIVLEIYALFVRIFEYGLTELRYIGIMLLLLQMIYIYLYIFKKDKICSMLIVFVVIFNFSLICPYLNMSKISSVSQFNILKKLNEKDNKTLKETARIKSSYNYLNNNVYGKIKLKNSLTKKQIKEIEYYDDVVEINYITATYEGKINISSYDTMYYLDVYDYGYNFNQFYEDYNYDLNTVLNKYYLNKDDINYYFENNHEIIIDNNHKYVLTYIYIYYDNETDKVTEYNLNGYMLTKKES